MPKNPFFINKKNPAALNRRFRFTHLMWLQYVLLLISHNVHISAQANTSGLLELYSFSGERVNKFRNHPLRDLDSREKILLGMQI